MQYSDGTAEAEDNEWPKIHCFPPVVEGGHEFCWDEYPPLMDMEPARSACCLFKTPPNEIMDGVFRVYPMLYKRKCWVRGDAWANERDTDQMVIDGITTKKGVEAGRENSNYPCSTEAGKAPGLDPDDDLD